MSRNAKAKDKDLAENAPITANGTDIGCASSTRWRATKVAIAEIA
jgi:hypothetical protein